MTSIGEISAAMMTMAEGFEMSEEAGPEVGDLRSALTTSLTPRRSVFVLAAVEDIVSITITMLGV